MVKSETCCSAGQTHPNFRVYPVTGATVLFPYSKIVIFQLTIVVSCVIVFTSCASYLGVS